MEKRKFILTVLMMVVLLAVAFAAEPEEGDRPGKEAGKEFYRSTVLPLMRAQHVKLLNVMTKEDAESVKELSSQWRDNMLMMHGMRCEAQAARIQQKPVDSSLEQEIQAQSIAVQSIIDRAESLAANYRGSINMLMGEMRAEIREKAKEEDLEGVVRPWPHRDGHTRFGRGPGGPPPVSPEVRFLLWGNLGD